MSFLPWLIVLAVAGLPAPSAFKLLDVETVEGRPVNRYRARELELNGKVVRTLLIDGNADGCFDAAGTDRVWVDLDGDGRFDPVAEQFPLGTPIPVGKTSYTVASDPWAHSVAAHERDTRLG